MIFHTREVHRNSGSPWKNSVAKGKASTSAPGGICLRWAESWSLEEHIGKMPCDASAMSKLFPGHLLPEVGESGWDLCPAPAGVKGPVTPEGHLELDLLVVDKLVFRFSIVVGANRTFSAGRCSQLGARSGRVTAGCRDKGQPAPPPVPGRSCGEMNPPPAHPGQVLLRSFRRWLRSFQMCWCGGGRTCSPHPGGSIPRWPCVRHRAEAHSPFCPAKTKPSHSLSEVVFNAF